MRMQFCLKSWRISAGILFAALAVVASTAQAFAQQPGEWGVYNPVSVAVAGKILSAGTLAEARNGGNLLDAWKADDNTNQVWLSYNDGAPFTISAGTQTSVSPAVVAFGPSNFLVFHTGLDGHIYYAAVSGANHTGWIQVPGNTTEMSVSVAQMGADSPNIYMVYRGSGNNTQVWGAWMNAQQEWSSAENIGGGLSVASPAICLNNTGSSLWVVAVGLDSQIWTTSQYLGAHDWPGWTARGVYAGGLPPSCAATAAGKEVMAYVDGNGFPHYASFDNAGNMDTGWTQDSSLFQTKRGVNLSSNGNSVFSLLTGEQKNTQYVPNLPVNQVYYQQVYGPNQ
jgi:hypothetical protein